MTAGLILLIIGIVSIWVVSAQRMRKELEETRSELKLLRETSGGLQETLEVRGRRLDVLLSSVSEAVMRVDSLGRVISANQRAAELFKMERGPELPQSMLVFIRDPDWYRAFSTALKMQTNDLHLPDIAVADRVLAPRLAFLGRDQALLLCMDVTERDKQERQQRQFLSNLKHDLKTPLTSLLGYARSLESFGHDPEFRMEASKVIADEAKHVNQLLDSLLTLDQIEFAQRHDIIASDPLAVFYKVKDVLVPRLLAKELSIELTQSGEMEDLLIAEHDVERVLLNVLENAQRYSPDGGVIRVDMRMAGAMAEIVVEDQGPGIPEKDLAKVTERFYRVDQARRRRKDGGHGLGLAIVKEMLEVHDGSLELANLTPNGLSLKITLPTEVGDTYE
ncbi:ATP-binding protein [Mariprofundus sp. KV]|uniref:sensor histidine kinase n=1 Tax=Mariprofundus sp. KV TaxID=2608715 RepID=UPI0015A257B6|nr:ATP-binding protein [Mariprofundus sp. KV]NWF36867.1 PAS domain-containing protein [Mariprofundus sp. KV]